MRWTNDHEPMRASGIKPIDWEPSRWPTYARFTGKFLLLPLIALLILVLSGCSKAVLIVPMPVPPANLASNCDMLNNPPEPLIDPDRAVWEASMITSYTKCSVKHRFTVDAWLSAAQSGKK